MEGEAAVAGWWERARTGPCYRERPGEQYEPACASVYVKDHPIRTFRTVGVWWAALGVSCNCLLAVEAWLARNTGLRAPVGLVLPGGAGSWVGRPQGTEVTLRIRKRRKRNAQRSKQIQGLFVGPTPGAAEARGKTALDLTEARIGPMVAAVSLQAEDGNSLP